ncbi:MAG: AbrB/MazE/SpoVT family DNA-binding domain-containing protein [Candidatus Binataceae bacterium]
MAKVRTETASTLTSKGQTTIPQEIRKRLKLRPGDRILYRVARDGQVILTPRKKGDIKRLYGLLAPAKRRVTVEEMNDSIAEAVCQRVLRH